jgi:RimJ/RimL family protein N-acetyltransferase
MSVELRTDRLLLRAWRPEDRDAFAALNADPRVIEFLPRMSRADSDAMVDRIERHFAQHGFGFWAVEIPGVTAFAGMLGLAVPRFDAHFTPCVEIGWRLGTEYWNRGYATEGARATLDYGFATLALQDVVAFTVPANVRSRRVMERLGMSHDNADDFEHPMLPRGHPLRSHVLYRKRAPIVTAE